MSERNDGILVIDKPVGLTSRRVVDQVQRWFPAGTKLGHCGTLDPLASGVLVLCVGRATRLVDCVQQQLKSYRSRFRLGAVSDTDDADGHITPCGSVAPPSREAVHAALSSFVGHMQQRPPAYCALKVRGRRAYQWARRGTPPELAPRRVHIAAIRLLNYDWPLLEVEIDCGQGTYIRAIARDVGDKLGCGGYVETLQRLRIGPFTLEHALPLQERSTPPPLLPPRWAVTHLPSLFLPPELLPRFRHGQPLSWPQPLPQLPASPDAAPLCAVYDDTGQLLGLGRLHNHRLLPQVVL